MGKLSALAVKNATATGKARYFGDGLGLWLQVSPSGAKSWVFRYTRDRRAREMGLGATHTISLADARAAALECRQVLQRGIDPLDVRNAAKASRQLEAAKVMTFGQCAASYIDAHRAGWKSVKHASQWENTLATYAYPVFGKLPVQAIDTALVMKALEPIWTIKNETATRLRGRIESVLGWATVRGYRTGDNPARWRGHLDNLLAKPSKVQKVEHHAALPFAEMGAFMARLRNQEGMGALALQFAILTAARSGEVRGATWDEIDLDAAVWTIPSSRMKAEKEHRVPLSPQAVALLRAQPRAKVDALVFPAPRGGMLSDMTMTATLKRMGEAVTAHGFRSSFRDWAGETTAYPREVIEHALAHQLQDKAEASYARGTLFDKRRRLMNDWAAYCDQQGTSASVTPIRSKGAK